MVEDNDTIAISQMVFSGPPYHNPGRIMVHSVSPLIHRLVRRGYKRIESPRTEHSICKVSRARRELLTTVYVVPYTIQSLRSPQGECFREGVAKKGESAEG